MLNGASHLRSRLRSQPSRELKPVAAYAQPAMPGVVEDDDSDEDVPLSKRIALAKGPGADGVSRPAAAAAPAAAKPSSSTTAPPAPVSRPANGDEPREGGTSSGKLGAETTAGSGAAKPGAHAASDHAPGNGAAGTQPAEERQKPPAPAPKPAATGSAASAPPKRPRVVDDDDDDDDERGGGSGAAQLPAAKQAKPADAGASAGGASGSAQPGGAAACKPSAVGSSAPAAGGKPLSLPKPNPKGEPAPKPAGSKPLALPKPNPAKPAAPAVPSGGGSGSKPAGAAVKPPAPKPAVPKPAASPAKPAAPKPAAPKPAAPKPSAPPAKPAPKPAAAASKPRPKVVDDDDDDDNDSSGSETSGSEESSDEESSDESDEPIQKKVDAKRSTVAKPKPPAAAAKPKGSGGAAPKRKAASPAKSAPRSRKKPKEEEGEAENLIDGDEPWFQDKDDVHWKKGAVKWRSLEHAGVLFPPAYVPHGVPLVYNGHEVKLNVEQEEACTFYAAMKDTDYGLDPKFQENFFEDWRKLLVKTEAGKGVKDFAKCDFTRIAAHVKAEDAKKKERSREEKLADKEAKQAQEGPFNYATIDGRKEKVGNFRVEPPGLFRGRGDHPKRGRMKRRIMPEDITINVAADAPVPPVPDMEDGKKHRWGAVVHDNKVTWLAKWKDSVCGQDKCVWLAANSSWKGMSDMAKYNKARQLKLHIERVRKDYMRGMKDSARKMQQRSVAVYLIDQLALRVGNEKNTEEEADTVGCCSLRVEHVRLHDQSQLELHFLGKDSIEFHNTVTIIPEAHALIGAFLKKKGPEDDLFEQIKPQDLNDYFHGIMDGLTAKVFRTYNASITLERLLSQTSERVSAQQIAKEGRETALCNFYAVANKEVAELCNHQRAAPKNFDEQMARIDERIDKVRAELKEAKKGGSSARAEQKSRQLEKMEADKRTKIELKNVALGTSRINYNDPRITVAWCKAHDVPITKPFNKSLLGKFTWAMSSAPDWRF